MGDKFEKLVACLHRKTIQTRTFGDVRVRVRIHPCWEKQYRGGSGHGTPSMAVGAHVEILYGKYRHREARIIAELSEKSAADPEQRKHYQVELVRGNRETAEYRETHLSTLEDYERGSKRKLLTFSIALDSETI